MMIYYNCDYMKNKNSWKEASEYIKEARKDPEFRKDLKEFIAVSSGKKRSK